MWEQNKQFVLERKIGQTKNRKLKCKIYPAKYVVFCTKLVSDEKYIVG